MPEDKTQRIRERIDRRNQSREKTISMLKEGRVQDDMVASAHRMIGHKSRSVALYHLVLDECDEAAVEFRTAATNYRKVIESSRKLNGGLDKGESIDLRYLLHAALLAGDEEILEGASDLTLETTPTDLDKYSNSSYHHSYVASLAAILRDTGDQNTFLDALDTAINDINPDYVEDDLHVLYRAWWRTLSGIAARDEQVIHDGLAELLAHHEAFSSDERAGPRDLVCFSGAALVVLARRNGMHVHVDSEYIPECVYGGI